MIPSQKQARHFTHLDVHSSKPNPVSWSQIPDDLLRSSFRFLRLEYLVNALDVHSLWRKVILAGGCILSFDVEGRFIEKFMHTIRPKAYPGTNFRTEKFYWQGI